MGHFIRNSSPLEPPEVCCHGNDRNPSFLPPHSCPKMSNMHNCVSFMTKHVLNIIVWCTKMEFCTTCIIAAWPVQPIWVKMGRFFIDRARFTQKLNIFLDSQVLSGLHHYDTQQIVIQISNLITILSTEIFIGAPGVCRKQFLIKLGKIWATFVHFSPKFQNILCQFTFKA